MIVVVSLVCLYLRSVSATVAVWEGTVDSSWSSPGNWAGGVLPSISIDASIPSNTPNVPIVSSTSDVRSFTELSTLLVTGASSSLRVHGSLVPPGIIQVDRGATLEFLSDSLTRCGATVELLGEAGGGQVMASGGPVSLNFTRVAAPSSLMSSTSFSGSNISMASLDVNLGGTRTTSLVCTGFCSVFGATTVSKTSDFQGNWTLFGPLTATMTVSFMPGAQLASCTLNAAAANLVFKNAGANLPSLAARVTGAIIGVSSDLVIQPPLFIEVGGNLVVNRVENLGNFLLPADQALVIRYSDPSIDVRSINIPSEGFVLVQNCSMREIFLRRSLRPSNVRECPTQAPTLFPTSAPSVSPSPTLQPSLAPFTTPIVGVTGTPTIAATTNKQPTAQPTIQPTVQSTAPGATLSPTTSALTTATTTVIPQTTTVTALSSSSTLPFATLFYLAILGPLLW